MREIYRSPDYVEPIVQAAEKVSAFYQFLPLLAAATVGALLFVAIFAILLQD